MGLYELADIIIKNTGIPMSLESRLINGESTVCLYLNAGTKGDPYIYREDGGRLVGCHSSHTMTIENFNDVVGLVLDSEEGEDDISRDWLTYFNTISIVMSNLEKVDDIMLRQMIDQLGTNGNNYCWVYDGRDIKSTYPEPHHILGKVVSINIQDMNDNNIELTVEFNNNLVKSLGRLAIHLNKDQIKIIPVISENNNFICFHFLGT